MAIKIKSYVLAAALMLLFINAQGQVEIWKAEGLDLIKNGYTHVVVDDLNFPGSADFLKTFKTYWTVTKGVDFVTNTDIKSNLTAGDSYFSLNETLVKTSMGYMMYNYLDLWVPKDKATKPGREYGMNDEISIAHIQLSILPDHSLHKKIAMTFSGNGLIMNWNAGLLKNYLQQMTALLHTQKKYLSKDVDNKAELQNLQMKPLYCTMDDFYSVSAFHTSRPFEEKELDNVLDGYKFSYKMLSNQELEDKILADKEPFYYLLHVFMGSDGKYLAVINSRTGEVVYCKTGASMSFNLKSGDLKDLSKAVEKSSK